MSVLDELSREELIDLVVRQQETITGQEAVIAQQQEQIAGLERMVSELRSRVLELERQLSGKNGPPPFVKPSVALGNKKAKDKARKQRSQSFVRRRETATEEVYHALSCCPDCGRGLSGGTEYSRHQVIEVPAVRARVMDHIFVSRWCGACQKRCVPPRELSEAVAGRQRFGIGARSLIGSLRTVFRLPVRAVQSLLRMLYGLRVSMGEIVEICHEIAQRGADALGQLQAQVRGSPYVHADETGWRENGQNGYLWGFVTPTVRYFHYDRSRAGLVARQVFGEQFGGVVVSDFYGAYNGVSGTNQRCWVHLLRDLHTLKEKHADQPDVVAWVDQAVTLYRDAVAYQAAARGAQAATGPAFGYNALQRRDQRRAFESDLSWLALPYLEQKEDPRHVLAQRLDRYAAELFVFIEHPDVPADNNAAERALRPCVIARKISGGTRSDKGSKTKAALMSLFQTWQANQLNTWEACQDMLKNTTLCQPAEN